MNEDDTFRILSRRPYEEVVREYAAFCVSVPSFESRVYFLRRHGWTLSEYEAEMRANIEHAMGLKLLQIEEMMRKYVQ